MKQLEYRYQLLNWTSVEDLNAWLSELGGEGWQVVWAGSMLSEVLLMREKTQTGTEATPITVKEVQQRGFTGPAWDLVMEKGRWRNVPEHKIRPVRDNPQA